MGLTAKETGGSKYPPVEQGLHQAICFGVYDLGTHYQEKYDKNVRKCLIMWELPEERIEVDRDGDKLNLPRAISKQYTLSLHEKSGLRRDLQAWRNKVFTEDELAGFDVGKLLSVNCMLQVLHTVKDGKTYANIASITPLPKGFTKQSPENPVKFFSFEDGKDIPEGTPPWVMEIIKASKEWNTEEQPDNGGNGDAYQPSMPDDDIPF